MSQKDKRSRLIVEPITSFAEGDLIKLINDSMYYSEMLQATVVVRGPYKYNLDSTPNLLIAKLIAPSTRAARISSLYHDKLYDTKGIIETLERGYIKLTKVESDKLYVEILNALGYHPVSAKASYIGLYLGGWVSWSLKPFLKRVF